MSAIGRQLFFKRDQRGVQTQLQHGKHTSAGLVLELFERVEIPWIDDQRFLADRVGTDAQRQPRVRVVQVVRRANRDVVDTLLVRAAAQFFEVPVETLELGEETDIKRIA